MLAKAPATRNHQFWTRCAAHRHLESRRRWSDAVFVVTVEWRMLLAFFCSLFWPNNTQMRHSEYICAPVFRLTFTKNGLDFLRCNSFISDSNSQLRKIYKNVSNYATRAPWDVWGFRLATDILYGGPLLALWNNGEEFPIGFDCVSIKLSF